MSVDVADVVIVELGVVEVVGEVLGDEVIVVDCVVVALVLCDVVGVLITHPVLKSPARYVSIARLSNPTVASQLPPACFR